MKQSHDLPVQLQPWSEGDLPLLEKLLGAPVMTEHLGGPEDAAKIVQRHKRYLKPADPGTEQLFAIVVRESERVGWVGYWESEWREQQIYEIGWSVLPAFQGMGIATRATAAAVELARPVSKHQFVHAFPSVTNSASNAICKKVGFSLIEEVDFEYPKGHFMRCNDWRLDLKADAR